MISYRKAFIFPPILKEGQLFKGPESDYYCLSEKIGNKYVLRQSNNLSRRYILTVKEIDKNFKKVTNQKIWPTHKIGSQIDREGIDWNVAAIIWEKDYKNFAYLCNEQIDGPVDIYRDKKKWTGYDYVNWANYNHSLWNSPEYIKNLI